MNKTVLLVGRWNTIRGHDQKIIRTGNRNKNKGEKIMESVYFCNEKIGKDVAKVGKEDEFMRISWIVREPPTSDKKGYFLYVQGTSEELKLLDEKVKDIGAEKVTGDEEKRIIDKIKAEEENAASGMGMIFG